MSIKLINVQTMIQKVNKNHAIIIDVRSQTEYKTSHISGAINLTSEEIKNGNIKKIEKYKLHLLIIVCNYESIAIKSASKLRSFGFSQVSVLKEGITGWKNNHLPLVS